MLRGRLPGVRDIEIFIRGAFLRVRAKENTLMPILFRVRGTPFGLSSIKNSLRCRLRRLRGRLFRLRAGFFFVFCMCKTEISIPLKEKRAPLHKKKCSPNVKKCSPNGLEPGITPILPGNSAFLPTNKAFF